MTTEPNATSIKPREVVTTAMIDAAMVEMGNLHPPMRRSECERLLRAALTAAPDPAPERCDDCGLPIAWCNDRASLRMADVTIERLEKKLATLTAERDAAPAPTFVGELRAVSNNGKRWRIVPDDDDWEMVVTGHITAERAKAICERIATADSSIARLQAERDAALTAFADGAYADACKGGGDIYQHALALTVEKFRAAEAQGVTLREALEFYADADRWDAYRSNVVDGVYGRDTGCDLSRDEGAKAVEVLNAIGEKV